MSNSVSGVAVEDGGYSASIVLDSLCEETGARVTTMACRYPRFIHSEMLTHRAFSRNSASSRAIPFPKLLQQVVDDPVIPIRWGHDGGGMKQGEEVPEALRPLALKTWLDARDRAVSCARALWEIEQNARNYRTYHPGHDVFVNMTHDEVITLHRFSDLNKDVSLYHRVHRSLPNRLIEPWMWITVIITATDWKNFFRQRCHEDAEVHMQKIAGLMRDALEASRPRTLRVGEWHLPLVTGYDEVELRAEFGEGLSRLADRNDDISKPTWEALAEISTARVARVSYLTHDGKKDWRKDLELAEKLRKGSGFGHWSPPEHPCVACDWVYEEAEGVVGPVGKHLPRHGNFRGFKQFRQFFANENGDA